MKKNRLTTTALALTLALALIMVTSVSAFAQKGGGQGKGRFNDDDGRGRMRMVEALELTDEQIAAHKDMKLESEKKLIPLHADLKLARLELNEMIANDASQSSIDQKVDAVGKIRTQIQKIRVAERVQFRNSLTDEQKKKLETLPMGRGFGGRGMGGDGDGPGFGARGGHRGMRGGGGHGTGDCPVGN